MAVNELLLPAEEDDTISLFEPVYNFYSSVGTANPGYNLDLVNFIITQNSHNLFSILLSNCALRNNEGFFLLLGNDVYIGCHARSDAPVLFAELE